MNIIKEKFNERRYKKLCLTKAERFRVESILQFTGKKKKVLDIGCCDGTISEMVAKNDNEVYGIDISNEAVNMARKKGIKVYKIDVETEDMSFPIDTFDTVIASEIIEHIFDTDQFLIKIKKILKHEGELIITTPNLAALGRRLLLLLGKNPIIEVSIDGDNAGHIRYFVKKTLTCLLEKHNFIVNKFTSDIINFNNSGKFYSVRLAKIFPTLGRTLITKAKNIKK